MKLKSISEDREYFFTMSSSLPILNRCYQY
uniref:Uncharacterized protein n=1 Tax=Arundo donax TaxID=35708 RepID=A0A0A9A2Z7_ARUDO